MKDLFGTKEMYDDDIIGEYLRSEEFKESFKRQIEKDTWENNLPKVYMDDNGNIVEHWSDGTINILKEKENG